MAMYFRTRHRGVPPRYPLVLLLTLVGLLGACGASTTPGSSTPTATPTIRVVLKGMITEFQLSASNSQTGDITAGPDGNLWFTEAVNGGQSGKIGRITPSGQISEFPLSSSYQAVSITAGPDSALWFTETASNKGQSGKIGRITPAGQIREFPLPSNNQPGDITVGPDGALWFTSTQIGRITPAGQISEFPLPSSSNGGDITAGPDDTLWFTEFGSNKIGRLA